MATDLRALRRRAMRLYGEGWETYFWAAVEQLASTDLCAYGLWVHGAEHPTLARLALSAHAFVWASLMEQHDHTLFVTPPEHGKTTFLRWRIEQWLGQQTEQAFLAGGDVPPALLVMNAADQAQKQAMTIAATIEANPRYQALFPHVEPDKAWGWTKDTMYLKRPVPRPDPSLMATGIFGPYQGLRFGLIVVDDPTDQEDARSDTVMDKQRERHQGVLEDRLLEGGRMHDIMTRWGKRDIPEMLLRSDDWRSETMPCYGYWEQHPEYHELFDGPPPRELWPEQWPVARLEKKRQQKELAESSALWQLAYLCSPVLAEGNMFKREWIQRADAPMEYAA